MKTPLGRVIVVVGSHRVLAMRASWNSEEVIVGPCESEANAEIPRTVGPASLAQVDVYFPTRVPPRCQGRRNASPLWAMGQTSDDSNFVALAEACGPSAAKDDLRR